MKERNVQYKAKAVITMGSQLLNSYRELMEDRFCCKVYDGYGCGGEGLNIAAQCENGSYHINEELMITEVDNREIVLTSLTNYAMPLIRYKPDDSVILGEKCSCGRDLQVIKKVIGRSHETVRTKRGDILVIEFFISAFEFIEGIVQYQVIQDTLDGVKLLLVVNNKYDRIVDEKKILDFITDAAGMDFKINISYVDKIPLEKNGKSRIIVSRL
jgi:phenylacetate-CoA ligase